MPPPRVRLPRRPRINSFFAPFAAWLLTFSALAAQEITPAPSLLDRAAGPILFEEWSMIMLQGKPCGFDSTITTRLDTPTGPLYRTVMQEEFVVKRLSTNLKMTETSKIIEDANGAVLSFEEVNGGAGSNIASTGRREGDDLVVSSRGETVRYKMPRLGALGPEAIRRLTNAIPLRPGQTFSFRTFESDYPQGVVIESGSVIGPEIRAVRGIKRKLWKISSATSLMPGLVEFSWVDNQSNDVESVTTIPGVGRIDEIVSTRAECMQQPEGAEIFAGSLIHPQRAILSPHSLAQADYRLTSSDKSHPLTLWNEGEQRVLSSGPGTSTIEVTARDIPPTAATWQLPHPDTPELHPYLQASAYLEVNAPEIQALARQAVGTEKNPVRAAHRIERFVRAYITKKDLNIGFASAEETAKSREGDCTEHAVLCAAIGRAAGLPTRCVLGFGYIPPGVDEPTVGDAKGSDTGIFGFHMWAEAWIGPDEWVPMDAALDGFDVGHIAITKTALEEINPLADLNLPILQLMQDLKIDVLKTVPKAPLH
jgi:hypothetical protein